MSIIYEPTGRAREYAPLAANLYSGCAHGCTYCFGPSTLRKTRDDFHNNVQPKKNALERLRKDAAKLEGNDHEILISFVTDPYQPAEDIHQITRRAIEILIFHGLRFTILTKGGIRAMKDFDLLKGYDKCSFGTTLVFGGDKAKEWEPSAPSPAERIATIIEAKDQGIKTWVSLEPVIDPDEALQLISVLEHIVDHWKVGKINHWPAIEKAVDWVQFRESAKALLEEIGADYYFKKSLSELDEREEAAKKLDAVVKELNR